MSKRQTKEEFKYKSNIVHKNKFDYSLVNYVNNHTKVIIICPIHGEFEQIPNSHLLGKGCKKCGVESAHKIQTKSVEDYVKDFQKVHYDKYDYSNLERLPNRRVKILCKKHGDFIQSISDHLGGHGCSKCGDESVSLNLRRTLQDFIIKSTNKHGDFYDYKKVEYISGKKKVIIGCNKHGDFKQEPENHIAGAGCPKCCLEFNSYIRSSYINRIGDRKVKIYLIECILNNEKFLKLGITVGTITNRYVKSKMPYNYEVVAYYEHTAETIYDLEQHFRSNFKFKRYKPNIKFNGYTECYKIEYREEILDEIKNQLKII